MKKTLKKIIFDGSIAIICIAIIVGIFVYLKNRTKSIDYDESAADNTISLIVIYQNDEMVIHETIHFTEGETLYHILDRTHTLECIDSVGVGKGIITIDEYESTWTTSYFMLYIDGVYSNEGVELIKPNDKMEIKFIWVEIK